MGKTVETESEEFADALFSAGTYCSAVCDLCGRTHFCNEDYGEWTDELDDKTYFNKLMAGLESEPDKYVICDYTIRFGTFDGKHVVEACPCGKLKTYEDWLWQRRDMILEYLTSRYQKMNKECQMFGKKVTETNEAKNA